MKKKEILGCRLRAYETLEKKLKALPLLAQGSVFVKEPPPGALRATGSYVWTRKVNNKTVTKALSKEQYEVLKEAIDANREVENTLRKMRTISQDSILKFLPDSPGKRKLK